MTTGRINQVAALVAGTRSPDPAPPENSRAEARQALTECRELNTGQAKQPSALRRPPLNLSPRGPAVHSSRAHQRSGDMTVELDLPIEPPNRLPQVRALREPCQTGLPPKREAARPTRPRR